MPKNVEMDKCVFLPIVTRTEILQTGGVTTCICLLIYGLLENNALFMGMYHWSGFDLEGSSSAVDEKTLVNSLVARLFYSAQQQLEHPANVRLYLDKLYIVGGERRQLAPNGELVLSGTEADVSALKKYTTSQCKDFFVTKKANFYTANFLTKNDQDLTITMNAAKPTWVINNNPTAAASEEDIDDGFDHSDSPSYKI